MKNNRTLVITIHMNRFVVTWTGYLTVRSSRTAMFRLSDDNKSAAYDNIKVIS